MCSPGRRRRGGSAQALRPLGRGVSGKEWLKLSIPLPRNPPLEPTCKGNAERPSESDHGSAGDLMPVTPLSRMSDKHSRPEALRPHPREWVCPCVSASKSPQLPTRNMSLQTDTSRLASDGVDGALHKHGRSPQSRVAFERQHAGADNAVVLALTLTARANPLISHNSSDRRRRRCYVEHAMARLLRAPTAFIRTGQRFGAACSSRSISCAAGKIGTQTSSASRTVAGHPGETWVLKMLSNRDRAPGT